MCKLVENSSRDVSIAFANELSIICDKAGINVWELIHLANKHPRVNILQPGTGVGGHCIAVDPWFIVSDFEKEAKIIKNAREINNYKTNWVIEKIKSTALQFELENNKKPIIALLGLAFKPDIDDLRESPALQVADTLLADNKYNLLLVEPNLKQSEKYDLFDYEKLNGDADIVAYLVAHKEFRGCQFEALELDFFVESKNKFLKELYYKFKKNEILNKGSSAFILKIIGSLLGYIFLLLVTRTAGAETWGVFALCLALLNIISIFSRMGIDTALLRYVAQFKGKMSEIKDIYFQGIYLVLVLSIVFSILLYFFSDLIAELVFQKSQLSSYFKIISYALVPFTIIHINVQTIRGLKKIKEFAFFQHVSKFLGAIVFFLLLTEFYNSDKLNSPIVAFTHFQFY